MNKLSKTMLLSTAVLFSTMMFQPGDVKAATSNNYGVKVQVNDELIKFPDAQPYVDGKQRTQVPIRFIAEQMGYDVKWESEGKDIKVTIKNKSTVIEMVTGENTALVNEKKVSFGTEAVLKGSRTYVPLRFIGETMGSDIQWDGKNSVVIVGTDGLTHTSVWTKPQQVVTTGSAVLKGEQITKAAMKYIGVPYLYGGTTTKGFDCSGFVKYIFGLSGKNLPRVSADQHKVGKTVKNLEVGDLVFFAHYQKTSHVGIYIGNNKFISATSSSGVKVDSLNSSYWGPKYVGAQRIL